MNIDGDCRLAGFRSPAVLRDGTAVCVRAIRPDDKERLRIAFARLSARSVYRRLFHSVKELTADDLQRLTEIDFRDHVGIVLTVGAGSDERLIADGRYVRVVSGGYLAEVAFTVADDYQHRGAATLLLRELVAIAREHGVRNVRRARAQRQPTDARGISAFEAAAPGVVRRWGPPCRVGSGRRGTRKSAAPPIFLRPPRRNPDAKATTL